ncbi:MAG: phosphoribosylanthranilate isomerase [Nitrospinaceae bacterium]|nr:phosphoribosylanthranilate isomerase [Nitrospinota bacterium]MDP7148284.1 phosphoribosylanthranilate isomerase [Nitrospinaceae bacterium]
MIEKLQPRVRVKICGTTSLKDALLAVESGADAVGFIFYKESPRNISQKDVKEIVAQLPPFVESIGVFVNETSDKINRIAEQCRLTAVQLHGDESPAFCRRIKRRVVKAVRVKDAESLKGMSDFDVSGFLLDAYNEESRGGTGRVFDWNLALRAKKQGPVIIAGGLNPYNVYTAIHRVKPYGVDVCSGVEKSPGVKDPEKISEFIKAVHKF